MASPTQLPEIDRRPGEVIILGGGMMGLSAAHEFTRAGRPVTLLEAAPEIGGVSASFSLGEVVVDRYYHTILPTDGTLLGLLDEVGLGERVSWRRVRSGLFDGHRIHPATSPVDLLRLPSLSPWQRLRLGASVLRARHAADWRDIEHLSCEEWLSTIGGDEVYRRFWRPLLRGKLSGAADEVSASFIWATINRLHDAKPARGVTARDAMGYLRGGYRVLLDALVARITAGGGRILTATPVDGLEPGPGVPGVVAPGPGAAGVVKPGPGVAGVVDPTPVGARWRVHTSRGWIEANDVVATLPPSRLRALVPPEIPLALGAEVSYLGAVVEVLLTRRPLSPYYILNLGVDGLAFTGVIEMAALAPDGSFGDRGVTYLPRYVTPDDPLAQASDAEVRAAFRTSLRRVFPDFDEDQVLASAVHRAPAVQPIHVRGYPGTIPPTRSAAGLHLASTAQIHPWPVHNDAVIRRSREVVQSLLAAPAADLTHSGMGT
jgi:protoporphyrinogen oxidase